MLPVYLGRDIFPPLPSVGTVTSTFHFLIYPIPFSPPCEVVARREGRFFGRRYFSFLSSLVALFFFQAPSANLLFLRDPNFSPPSPPLAATSTAAAFFLLGLWPCPKRSFFFFSFARVQKFASLYLRLLGYLFFPFLLTT